VKKKYNTLPRLKHEILVIFCEVCLSARSAEGGESLRPSEQSFNSLAIEQKITNVFVKNQGSKLQVSSVDARCARLKVGGASCNLLLDPLGRPIEPTIRTYRRCVVWLSYSKTTGHHRNLGFILSSVMVCVANHYLMQSLRQKSRTSIN